MSKLWKIALAIVVLLLIAALAIPFFIDADSFRPMLQSALQDALGRPVSVGQLRLSIWQGGVSADEIRIEEDPAFGDQPFLTAEGLSAGIQWMPLLRERRLVVEEVVIRSPSVRLLQNRDMRWNFDSLGKKKPSAAPTPAPGAPAEKMALTVQRVRLTNASAFIRPAGTRAEGIVVENMNLTLREIAQGTPIRYEVEGTIQPGATFASEGTVGPLPEGDASLSPVDATFSLNGLDLIASGIVKESADLEGKLSGEGTLKASGGTANVSLNAQVADLAVGKDAKPAPKPVTLNATVRHQLPQSRGTIQSATVSSGEATARLSGSYRLAPDGTILDLTLSGDQLPVNELTTLLPSFGVVLPEGATLQGGTLSLQAQANGPTSALDASGVVRLDESVLTGYSLGRAIQTAARLAGLKVSSDTPINLFRADLAHAPGQTRMENIELRIPQLGELTGNVNLDTAQNLDGNLTARIETSGGLAGAGLERITGSRDNVLTLPLTVGGTATNPVIGADANALKKTVTKEAVEQLAPKAKSLLNKLLGGKKQEADPPPAEPEKP